MLAALQRSRKVSLRPYVNQGLNEVSFAENWVRFYDLDDKHAILAQVKQLLAFEERKTRRRSNKPLDALDVAWLPFAHFPFKRTELELAYGTIFVDEMAVSDICDDCYVVGTLKSTTRRMSRQLLITQNIILLLRYHSLWSGSKIMITF